jgi:hypothetical protein
MLDDLAWWVSALRAPATLRWSTTSGGSDRLVPHAVARPGTPGTRSAARVTYVVGS